MNEKILFWQTSDWFNYNLANSLQEHDLKLYSIIDTVNKPKKFFQDQKFVNYEKIWFFHDTIQKDFKYDLDYLNEFETNYKINLWLLATNERIFYKFNPFYQFSTEEILSIIEQECRFFESVINDVKPDYLIISLTWQHQGELLRQMCKAKGIKILMINTSELGAGLHWTITEEFGEKDYDNDVEIKTKENITFEDLREFFDKMRTKDPTKENSKSNNKNKKKSRLIAGLNVLSSKNINNYTHFPYYGRTRSKLIKNELNSEINTKKRKSFIDENFQIKYNQNEKNVIFFLHTEQERALLISAPFFTNQIETIRHIVKSLPIGYKLFVKEHPGMKLRGWREISEYKEIMDIPNVIMIHPDMDSLELIKDSELIISINSTAGFEALFFNKPSINFQRRGYSEISSSFVVGELNDLPALIRKALKTQVNPQEVYEYVQRLTKELFDFDYMGFVKSYNEKLHANDNLVDVIIDSENMKQFLELHKDKFDKISLEYIKKINEHKENNKSIV